MQTTDVSPSLTPFQKQGRDALERFFAARRVALSLTVVEGEQEAYLVARPEHAKKLEVFLYEDEAGFFLEQTWHPYESVDFDSSASLLDKLLSDLDRISRE
jgi:tellurite resistance-related uncharacterized protein